jgi:hypothetical protein
MSSGDGSNGNFGPKGVARDSAAVVLKVLQAATTWLRCRNLLVAKRTDDARIELTLLHAALRELDGQPLSEEHAQELRVLHEEASRLDAKLRSRTRDSWSAD